MKHYIIPIFIPHYGCPHQCIFCNQKRITGLQTPVTPEAVTGIINEQLSLINKPRHIEIAFYGGSFTALSLDIQQALLTPAYLALKSGKVHAIRISTRPDYITHDILNLVSRLGVSIIELGAQSLDDLVLQTSVRGHTSQAIARAVKLIKSAGIKCGLQLMVGLPGETWASLIKTTYQAVELEPDFTRIYPTLVIADTQLAQLYKAGAYKPLTISEAISRSAFMKLIFTRNNIPVIRTGLQASEGLASNNVVLAGPYHPAFGEMVDSHLFNAMIVRCLEHLSELDAAIIIHHHTKDTSKVRGLSNSHINAWHQDYHANIKLVADGPKPGYLLIETLGLHCVITNTML
ncbi:hypothetical protein SDC9_05938 [bioreactor metagenome]|uniref:Radical SAM core domain-containing protein n=1 Tax=bioreactor metagenome TaxID=1076179 RepID=A0A644T1M0_9ZZZZ|nr:radical SAM protein [Negativicutes bacterium]